MTEREHRLLVRRDLRTVTEVSLGGDTLTIGRSPRCDVTLEHPSVSRFHARLEHRQDCWRVIDNNSTNGLLLNGQKAKEALLMPGDLVEIRPFLLSYVTGPDMPGDQSIRLAESGAVTGTARVSASPSAVVRQRLEDLYSLAQLVIRPHDGGALWRTIQAALERSLAADRCVLVGLDDTGNLYRLVPPARPSGTVESLDVSRSVLGDVVASRQGVLVEHVDDDQKYAQAVSLAGGGVGSVICVPIVMAGRTRAIVYADRRRTRRPFGIEDLEFVAASADLAAAAGQLDELHDKAPELARVQGRIETAREIQELLLPSPIPQPSWGHVAACNVPADQMSGDIYDVMSDASGRLVLMVADVAGKGVPAAFLTAVLQNTLRLTVAAVEDLGEIVERVNAAIDTHSPDDSFVTMILCRWSADGESVEIANAGHLAPLWLKTGGAVQPFPEGVGLALGLRSKWDGKIVRYDAADVAAMMLYSDGAIEAANEAGELHGVGRLSQALAQHGDKSAEALLAALVDGVERFCAPHEPADDVTMLVAQRTR